MDVSHGWLAPHALSLCIELYLWDRKPCLHKYKFNDTNNSFVTFGKNDEFIFPTSPNSTSTQLYHYYLSIIKISKVKIFFKGSIAQRLHRPIKEDHPSNFYEEPRPNCKVWNCCSLRQNHWMHKGIIKDSNQASPSNIISASKGSPWCKSLHKSFRAKIFIFNLLANSVRISKPIFIGLAWTI